MPLSPQYLAGIVDADGCIQFAHNRSGIYARVLITNTYLPLLQAIQQEYGGDIQRMRKTQGWKQGYNWRISWTKAVDFLEELSPYLIVKTEQANLVFAWDICREGRGKKFDKETQDYLVEQMTKLNRRGDDASIQR